MRSDPDALELLVIFDPSMTKSRKGIGFGFRKTAVSFGFGLFIAIIPGEESRGQQAADVLSPDLRRIIFKFDSDDTARLRNCIGRLPRLRITKGRF